MKNRFIKLFTLLVSLSLIIISCDLDDMINNRPVPGEEEVEETISYQKKGFGQTVKSPVWSNCVSLSLPYWHYSWGSEYPEGIPENVEFVPMIWGRSNVEEKVAVLKKLAEEGKITHLLGFNEPDKEDQAHMTVEEAIALWPLLESVGVPLGSPAPAAIGSGWLDDFMAQANAKGLRVDFICMHRYADSIDPLKWMEVFQRTNEQYNLPIWITEMGLADWTATSPETNKRTKEQAHTLMEELLPMMDAADYIQRYAWFDGGRAKNQAALHISAIFEQNSDILTDLGILYAEHDANIKTGGGNSVVPEAGDYGLVIDGGFELRNADGAWGGYDNVFTEETAAKKGLVVGKIQPDKNGDGGSLLQEIEVEPNTTYAFSYSTKWAEKPDGTIKVQVQDRTPDTKPEAGWERLYFEDIATDTEWADTNGTFTTGATTSKVFIIFYKGGTNDNTNAGLTTLYIDEVSLFKTESSEPTPEPNPVPDSKLIVDGGFENMTSGPLSGTETPWYGFDGNIVENIAEAKTGSKYVQLAKDNNKDGAFLNQEITSLNGNKIYTVNLSTKWLTSPSTSGLVKVFDITGGQKVELLSTTYNDATVWTDNTFDFQTTATTTAIRITIIKPGGESENTVLIDDVIMEETGTVDVPPVVIDLVSDGDFEQLTAGALNATSTPWSGYASGSADVITSAIATAYEGEQCGRLKKDDASIIQTITVEEGKTYTFSLYSKWIDGAGKDLKFTIKPSNNNALKYQETIVESTDWSLTTFEYTVPAGHTSITFNIFKGKDTAGGVFLLDNVSVIEK
ncbi:glycosyl hydrolase [Flammeovirga kamogawensis]|uniref:Carbohydrate binding domain-containing protein n=1 Tax=Flammeovirga kamogawensis TaxID=373891 RepID=A0ABX8H3J2_9BACT|nr:glycosyl hydrolase [Flammeovirga kamogawensis]MBB6463161.1 hypothetical protein [Flammeovirga kamogawensis]QWG10395.1 carbohydrate binding domain-containing protein [Flammeovirga kamogawensis]TRX63905.1 hypothetical protein EO216_26185 [Flammeovirga kamogawensis]